MDKVNEVGRRTVAFQIQLRQVNSMDCIPGTAQNHSFTQRRQYFTTNNYSLVTDMYPSMGIQMNNWSINNSDLGTQMPVLSIISDCIKNQSVYTESAVQIANAF